MHELLRQLSERNIRLDVNDDGQLLVNAPAGAVTADLAEYIRQHKSALIDLLKKHDSARALQELPQIVPDPARRHEPFPLNAVQHAYWIGRGRHMELGGVSTHFYFELECQDVDLDRLERSFRNVIRSNEMLRAVISVEGLQRVLPQVPDYHIRTLDLRGASRADADGELLAIREQMAQQVIDCSQWPLFELRAARLDERSSVLCLSWDFLVVDAWSILTIFRQWRAFYSDPTLPPRATELSFRDYVLGEERLKSGAAYQQAQQYWWERIDTLPLAPQLPVRSKIEAGRTYAFTRRRLHLSAPRWQRLARLAQAEAITPSNLLLAIFSEVLNRWSKTRHYSLNLTLFNRLPLHADVMDLVGDFTTLVVTEIGREPQPSFVARAKAIQHRFLDDFAQRQFSGVEVLREIAKRRQLGQRAIMPVVFTSTLMLKHNEAEAEADRGLEQFGRMRYGITQTPQVLLDCQIFEVDGALAINWDAVEELFLPGVLDAMFDSLSRLVDLLADDVRAWQRDDLVALPPSQQAVRERDHGSLLTSPVADDGELLHSAFLRQARAQPDAIAVIGDDVVLSYGELLARSCQVAEALLDRGVGRSELVAVVMDKGWQQVVAVLGILIAGAAYLPVDPALPEQRQSYLLQCGEVNWTLVSDAPSAAADAHAAAGGGRITVVREPVGPSSAQLPAARQTQRDIAYVIFTSGSSGTPKGVAIDHRGALNTVKAMNALFGVSAADRILAVSSLSFDLSVYDIFGLLAVGGAVVMPPREAVKDAQCWSRLIEQHQVTLWNSAPQLMGMLVDFNELQPGYELHSLRSVWLSGDWIPPKLPGRIRELARTCEVVSLGGATEASIWSIYHRIEGDTSEMESIPYGKALPGQTMQVLDADLRPCPDHVIGNIYIGGLGLALGYWKDPQKTEHHFIVHPRTAERLYRTGDLGRYFDDGSIEFLGREDEQVKLHGHRVELGEIAAQLKALPVLEDAAVHVVDGDGGQTLVACVVVDRESAETLFETVEAAGGQAALAARLAQLDDVAVSTRQLEDLAYFAEFWSQLGAFCLHGMYQAVGQLGLDGEESLDTALERAGVLPRYRFLVEKWLFLLQQAGGLARDADGRLRRLAPVGREPTPQQQADYASDVRVGGFYRYVRSCLASQLALLRGEVSPLELLFPDGDFALAASIYESNPVAVHHNRQAAAVVETILQARSDSAPLCVLEIGAGTGATTASLLPLFSPGTSEYWFTDLSPFFLDRARQKFAAYDFVHYELFNLDRDVAEQGLQSHRYDLIVAANVLHDAKHVEEALIRLRQLLKPGGHLLLIEGTEDSAWQWVTVAYLEGVGLYQDGRADSHSPILDTLQWREALLFAGFRPIASHPRAAPGDSRSADYVRAAMPQHVIVAQAPERARRFNPEPLRAHLAALLPDYMVPQIFVELAQLPLTANGKVDKTRLPRHRRAAAQRTVVPAAAGAEQIIHGVWKDVLKIDSISVNDNFFDLGGDSLLLTQVLGKLGQQFERGLTMADLFSYPTIRSLSDYLGQTAQAEFAPAPGAATPASSSRDIAIIGMSGRFPDAANVESFWVNVRDGVCSVRCWDDATLLRAGVPQALLADPRYVKAGVPMDDIDLFDAAYFGFTPREAQIMDPQLRMLLEESVVAMEQAGYANEKYAGSIGVFVGKDVSQYLYSHLFGRTELMQSMGIMAIANVNEKDYAATQISYNLGFTGPSLNINTACSTSLVAVHQACQSLLMQECRVALAGGVSLETTQPGGYLYREGSIASPDGYCRAFSDDANGCVRGSGLGLVVLKPLQAALADRDTVHAVIKGSAINNDGALKIGFTAPSMQGQARVITAALHNAGVAAAQIQYVEAHGTGTSLGDPIEVKALAQVFNHRSGADCAIGSVKTNVGHLDAAAGVAGLIKVVQSIKYAQLPPSLHFRAPSPRIDFADGALHVNGALRDWPPCDGPRRAGVSSFGVGGTNAHVVLEQAPAPTPAPGDEAAGPQLILLSAKTRSSLRRMAAELASRLGREPVPALDDLAYTLQVGRNAHRCRLALVCSSVDELGDSLRGEHDITVLDTELTPTVIFLFPGTRTPLVDETSALYATNAVFREHIDHCATVLEMYLGRDIRALLYSGYAESAGFAAVGSAEIEQMGLAQPLQFAVDYALARLWLSLGVHPEGMLGVGLGEYVAACIAGVFSVEEALSLVVVRGQLMQDTPAGRSLAVGLGEQALHAWLQGSECDLAAVDGPSHCVVAGSESATERLAARLKEQGVSVSVLAPERAFHSRLMQSVVSTFADCVREVERKPLKIPFVSSLTGRWITDAEASDPDYWARQLRHPLRFGEGLAMLSERRHRCFLEVAPGDVLGSQAVANGVGRERIVSPLAPLAAATDVRAAIAAGIGQLWRSGIDVDWPALHAGRRPRRIPLPGYAFERQSYWFAPFGGAHHAAAFDVADAASCGERFPRPELKTDYVAPQGELQQGLAALWQEFLAIAGIGANDNFFELGGDSLLGVQLNEEMKKRLKIDIPVGKLFQLATVRNIANYHQIVTEKLPISALSDEEVDEILRVYDSA